VPATLLVGLLRARAAHRTGASTRLFVGLGLGLVAALAVCLALWPALRVRGPAVLRQVADFAASNGAGEGDNFFLGRPVEDPGLLFYPLSLLFRATPLVVIGLVLLAYFAARRDPRVWSWPVALLAGYAVGFVLMMTLGQKKFDRYALPAVPALDLLAGLGLWLAGLALLGWWRSRRPLDRSGPLRTAALVGGGSLLFALLVWPLASVSPYPLAYYNPLLGGGSAAQQTVFVGWGEGLDRVAAYLNGKPILLEAPTVATAYHRVLQAHLQGHGALPLERAELADYIVPYVNTMQRQQDADLLGRYVADQEPEYVVWLNGIEYARVYRGPHLAREQRFEREVAPGLRLESMVLAPGSGRARPGHDLHLRLRWRSDAEPSGLIARIRLADSDGRQRVEQRVVLAEALREDGLLVVESRLRLPATLPPGEYTLVALLEAADRGRAVEGQAGVVVPLQNITILPAGPR
jgi:hypothetical protein